MKRRTFLSSGLSSLALALGSKYVPSSLAQVSPPVVEDKMVPMPAASDLLFRFVVAGDVGTGEAPQYAVAQAMSQYWQQAAYPMVLLTGDNIYPNGEISRVRSTFEQPYADLLSQKVKFYAVLGNHDVRTNQGRDQIAYPGYNMPSRYYSFVRSPVHFFALDTNQAHLRRPRLRRRRWRRQLRWLRQELAQSQSPWKVVYAHHSIYSSGAHGSSSRLRRTLAPILREYGVQLYISGHDHNYERTRPVNGTTYITSGNGAKLRPVGQSRWTAHAASVCGFTAFEVYADQIVVKAIATPNSVYDQGQVLRAPYA